MVRFVAVWIILQVKSSFKRVSFYLLTGLIILVLVLADRISFEAQADEVVLICTNGTMVGKQVLSYLNNNTIEGYIFENCENVDEICDRVIKSEISCGIVFDVQADEQIPEVMGIVKKPEGMSENYRDKAIALYQSPGYPQGDFMMEILFPILQREYSDLWINNYVPAEIGDYVDKLYSDKKDTMNLNLVEVVEYDITGVTDNMSTAGLDKSGNISNTTRLIRTIIICALILITIIIGLVEMYKTDIGFYSMFGPMKRGVLKVTKLLAMLIPVWAISLMMYLLYLNLIY